MAMIPGMFGQLPGSSWIRYPVRKTKDGYYIKGYSNFEFQGSFRDIAKQIVLELTQHPEFGCRKGFTGPFHIDPKQNLICVLCMEPDPDPPDLDIQEINRGISEELKSLLKLIPFS